MSTATPPPVRRYVSQAVGIGFAVALVCGVGGSFVAEDVVGGLGRLLNHDEFALRVLGWCWGGLPFVVLVLAYSQRHRLSQRAKRGFTYTVTAWAASGALLIPGRHTSAEERFGEAYLDSRPLGFGWAAGFMALFATFLVAGLLAVVWRKLTGTVTRQSVTTLNRGLTVLWVLFTVGGLVAALLAPMP
ncbi:hypothetical protein [Kribbella sp. NPDC023855]|uniref:hypothetical protein n=1 Tax=Kribbella sp. NPDC023855 TaxID=3154698 RepID=UPI0033CE6837